MSFHLYRHAICVLQIMYRKGELMKYNSLILEKKDFVMIKRFLQISHYLEDYAHKDALETLELQMAGASIYNFEDMPDDVVRLYSLITVSSATGWEKTFQVVLPTEHDIAQHKISVQSTLGASVIGLSEEDEIRYGLPANINTLKIKKVTQSKKRITTDIPDELFSNVLPEYSKNNLTLNI